MSVPKRPRPGDKPVNGTAARVIQRGTHYHPDVRLSQFQFDVQPPLADPRHHDTDAVTVDLTGHRFGRLTVVGYWGRTGGRSKGKAGQRWACRCACGLYVIRTARTIEGGRDPDDKCLNCKHLDSLRRDQFTRPERA